jgi:4-methyl-5(b-hydroxyethyl)-thiazole monophosphate biosynthesis
MPLKNKVRRMSSIITVLAQGFEETEAVTFIDLLRRAGVTVTVLGLDSSEVNGSHNITIIADKLFKEFSGPFDGIVLPGGQPGTKNLAASAPLLDRVRATYKRGGLCAAICAAPIVLGKAGILAGHKATCYPGLEKELGGAQFVEEEVVRDRNVITSRGVGTAIPFALELISYLLNPAAAEKIKKSIVYT